MPALMEQGSIVGRLIPIILTVKFGIRTPSLRRRIAARTSLKRYVRHSLGVKAPRGMGWITNPRKAAYNRVYNRTTFSVDRLFARKRRSSGGEVVLVFALFGIVIFIFKALFLLIKTIFGGSSEDRKAPGVAVHRSPSDGNPTSPEPEEELK